VFDVEQRRVQGDPHHRLIWLLPRVRITDPLWICVYTGWYETMLKRKTVCVDGVKTLWDPISDQLSVGLEGSDYSVTLTGKLFQAIQTRLTFKDSKPFVSDVERMLKDTKHTNYVMDAPILFEILPKTIVQRPNVVRTGNFSTCFAALPQRNRSATEDTNNPAVITTTPLISSPALYASRGRNADNAVYEGRIEAVRNKVKMTKRYKELADVFVRLVIPDEMVGKGVPYSTNEVGVMQDKPAQQGRFKQAAPVMSSELINKIKCFIKGEPYRSAKMPRNIATMSPEVTIRSSAFSLAIADVLKQSPWYCPGKTPSRIAERLAEVCNMEPEEDLEEGDYTCLDGTQSEDLHYHLTRAMYFRYFAVEYHFELKTIFKAVYEKYGMSADGVRMLLEFMIRSGCSFTTHAGSMINAFVVFCALIKMGYSVMGSWARIGAIFGDDSLNANHRGSFRLNVEVVAKELGLLYKSVLRPRGEPVLFLGRYFIDPLTTSDSFADPMRTISKLHLTGNKQVSPAQGAANKAHGYLATDKLTPIIGTWAKRVLSITGLGFRNGTGEEQYKCSNAWPQKDAVAIKEAMASVLGISTAELHNHDLEVEGVTGLDQFPVVLDADYCHTQLAVVDGQLVGDGTGHHQLNTPNNERPAPRTTQLLHGEREGSNDVLRQLLQLYERGDWPRHRGQTSTRRSAAVPGGGFQRCRGGSRGPGRVRTQTGRGQGGPRPGRAASSVTRD